MSRFVGGTADTFGGMLLPSDDRAVHVSAVYQWQFMPPRRAQSPWTDGLLWPNSKSVGTGLQNGGLAGDASSDAASWEPDSPAFDDTGGQQEKIIVGQTLDSTGAALGSCIVKGFAINSDPTGTLDVEVGQVTSDTAGYFRLPTQYAGAFHYLVAYKSGSPDVAGTTVKTLVGV